MALNLGSIFYQLGVDTTGLNKANKNVKHFQTSTNRSFQSVNKAANVLKTTLASLISIEAIRRTALLADDYQKLQSRIKATSEDTAIAVNSLNKLEKIAAKTGDSLLTTLGSFQKFQMAKDTVKGTTDEMVILTETLLKMGKVGGASQDGLNSAMLQFSQGLAGGLFQAEEMNSVIEGIPGIVNEMAKGMGITVEEFIKLKKSGEILSKDVFEAILKQSSEINERFEKLPMTIDRGISRLLLGFQQGVGEIDNTLGLTRRLGELLFKAGEYASDLPIYLKSTVRVFNDLTRESDKMLKIIENIAYTITIFIGINAALLALKGTLAIVGTAFSVFLTPIKIIKKLGVALFALRHAIVLLGAAMGMVSWPVAIVSTLIIGLATLTQKTIGLKTAFEKIKEIAGKIFENLKIGEFLKVPLFLLSNLLIGFGKVDEKAQIFKNTLEKISGVASNAINSVKGLFGQAQTINADVETTDRIKKEYDVSVTPDEEDNGFLQSFFDGQVEIIKQFQSTVEQLKQESLDKQEAQEKAARDAELKILKEKGYAKLKMEENLSRSKYLFTEKLTKAEIEDEGDKFRTLISNAASHSKELAAIQKAMALFDIAVKTPQAVAGAFAYGNSIGGTPAGIAFAAIAGAAMGAQAAAVASQNFTPRAVGGDVFPGGSYLVGEHGPELLTMGSARGSITTNTDLKSGLGAKTMPNNVVVNVYPIEGTTANVRESQDAEGNTQLDVIMERVDSVVAEGIQRGNSQVSQSISSIFGLNRATGAAF
jgi:tape measure domain-containing protein